MLDRWVEALARCENSDPKKNRYGLMCFSNGKNQGLCTLAEDEAKKEAKRRLKVYGVPTLYQAMHYYTTSKGVNNHIKCIEQYSGISSSFKFL